MKTHDTETLFKRVGRKYVPVRAYWHEDAGVDYMAVGTFRLTYAYADGGKRYEYEVTPATAPVVAAMMIAKVAIEDALRDASKMQPSGTMTRYTKRELALIEKFRADMGGMMPTHWTSKSAYEISGAAMRAVVEFKP